MTKQQVPTEFQNPTEISRGLVERRDGSLIDDIENGKLAIKSITDSIAIDGISTASSISVIKFGEEISERKLTSDGITSDTIFCAGSITKIVTAATIVRMTEEEKYKDYLVEGIKTKLCDILPVLEKHYPESKYINEDLEKQPNFGEITLQHLLQHTSGISNFSGVILLKEVYDNVNGHISKDMLDTEKSSRRGKYGENIGEHSYNNVGYELLGRIAVSIASEVKESKAEFGDIVSELVIDRVKEKVGSEKSEAVKFFTADQMERASDGKAQVKDHRELQIESSKFYHDKNFLHVVPSCIYHDMTAGGGYTTANSMSMIAFHILSDKKEFSIFKEDKTLEIFNSEQISVPDGYYKEPGKHTYGLGYRSFADQKRYRGHGGLDFGSNSQVMVDNEENKVATTMIAFENLTLAIAYALKNKAKSDGPIEINPELYKKTLELSKNYSESQLVEMRNDLEKSYEDFKEKFDLFRKQKIDALDLVTAKPSPITHTKEISRVKGSKFNEI